MNIQKPTLAKRLELRQIPANETIVMKHRWRDLLFLHWEMDPQEIQATLPEGLYADTFNERAYVGVTPFFLYDVRPVFIPSIPLLSDFLEVNVRTYVYDKNGTPGVWFYSLDANQPVAVKLAQQINLPYRYADIKGFKTGSTGEIIYNVKRKNTSDALASEFRYIRKNEEFFPDSESLEFFLVERYLLFSFDLMNRRLSSISVYHHPYPLSSAELIKWDDNLLKLNGLSVNKIQPDHIIFSQGVDVDIYNIRKVKYNE
jgi:uncharacterized protein